MNEQSQNNYKHSLVDSSSQILVYGWMVAPHNEGGLHLSGAELYVYAVVYACSNMPGNLYTSGLDYLAAWTQCTKRHIIRCLHSLQDKNYIAKYEKFIGNIRFCAYKVTKCVDARDINGYRRIDNVK